MLRGPYKAYTRPIRRGGLINVDGEVYVGVYQRPPMTVVTSDVYVLDLFDVSTGDVYHRRVPPGGGDVPHGDSHQRRLPPATCDVYAATSKAAYSDVYAASSDVYAASSKVFGHTSDVYHVVRTGGHLADELLGG